nr:phage tail sheath C-terminal domain-containing protein [uncultured Desulfobacter sp.]
MKSSPLFPGIYFEVPHPPVKNKLPRMDIAAFVGFAASGPLHTPVVVEDMIQFRDIFGEDIPLAWDTEKGQVVKNYLGSTVEAFFRNGGLRCWIVRVADEKRASSYRFTLPGVLQIGASQIKSVKLAARSPGNWSKNHRTNTVLEINQLQIVTQTLSIDNQGWSAVVRSPAVQVETGDLLKISLTPHDPSFYVFVDTVFMEENGTRLSGTNGFLCFEKAFSSPPAEIVQPLEWQDWCLCPLADADVTAYSSGVLSQTQSQIQLLRFEIQAWKGSVLTQRIGNVTFHPSHPRFFGNLPSDKQLYARHQGKIQPVDGLEKQLFVEQANQSSRFPFCASEEHTSKAYNGSRNYLPLGMGLLTRIDEIKGPVSDDDDVPDPQLFMEQDGLQEFHSGLFLDDKFISAGSSILGQEIEQHLYWDDTTSGLHGIYSLFPVQEVTLIAVPDAIHRKWDRIAPKLPNPFPAPVLEKIRTTQEENVILLQWSRVERAIAYIIEQDRSKDFKSPIAYCIRNVSQPVAGETQELLSEPETSHRVSLESTCEGVFFFRVRAKLLGEVSLWSNTRAKIIPESAFLECCTASPELWNLQLISNDDSSPPGKVILSWTSMDNREDALALVEKFELQQANDAEFNSVKTIDNGKDQSIEIKEQPDAVFYFRVRGRRGNSTGPWSNIERLGPSTLSRMTLQPLSQFEHDEVLDVHRALVRLCKARGDLMAVLGLPRHFRKKNIMAYLADFLPTASPVSKATSGVPGLTPGENDSLGFAALYYPWLALKSRTFDSLKRTADPYQPPDGAITGLMARRALEYGPWSAPAAAVLENVVALEPPVAQAHWEQLLRVHINVIHNRSAGFMPLSEETLSFEDQRRYIHVRRLLILLRRLALREGQTYVFEPNSDDFRDRVRNQFEALLEGLYNRGAFSGVTTDSAYRVVTDESVNTNSQIDLGRFIMEIHVAPSQPLKFLKIRLVQSDSQGMFLQEL